MLGSAICKLIHQFSVCCVSLNVNFHENEIRYLEFFDLIIVFRIGGVLYYNWVERVEISTQFSVHCVLIEMCWIMCSMYSIVFRLLVNPFHNFSIHLN